MLKRQTEEAEARGFGSREDRGQPHPPLGCPLRQPRARALLLPACPECPAPPAEGRARRPKGPGGAGPVTNSQGAGPAWGSPGAWPARGAGRRWHGGVLVARVLGLGLQHAAGSAEGAGRIRHCPGPGRAWQRPHVWSGPRPRPAYPCGAPESGPAREPGAPRGGGKPIGLGD